jgi:hypothetical protein
MYRDMHVAIDYMRNPCKLTPWGPFREHGPWPTTIYPYCVDEGERDATYKSQYTSLAHYMLLHAPKTHQVVCASDFGVGVQLCCFFGDDRFCYGNPRVTPVGNELFYCEDEVRGQNYTLYRPRAILLSYLDPFTFTRDEKLLDKKNACMVQAQSE